MSEIRIDAPGAGEWVMSRAGGYFCPGWNHSFTVHRDGEILGGFVLCDYLGASMSVHMAGTGFGWCSRELLWLTFHYAFEQLGCCKIFAPVKSTNHKSIAAALRVGGMLEATLRDAFPDAHLLVMSMRKEDCPWLGYTPRKWRAGGLLEAA